MMNDCKMEPGHPDWQEFRRRMDQALTSTQCGAGPHDEAAEARERARFNAIENAPSMEAAIEILDAAPPRDAFKITRLDGDDPIQTRIECLPHFSHASSTDRRKDFVRAELFACLKRHVSESIQFSRSRIRLYLDDGASGSLHLDELRTNRTSGGFLPIMADIRSRK